MAGVTEDLGAWRSFTRDLAATLQAWVKSPLLPVATVAFGVTEGLFATGRIHVPADFIRIFG